MKVSIFIRSWRGDRFWLYYCLKSLAKFAKGFTEIVVALPVGDEPHFENFEWYGAKVVWSEEIKARGYLAQQASKLLADEHCSGDYILFVDSDCIALKEFHFNEFFGDRARPIQLIRHWENVGDALVWKGITELAMGCESHFEHMAALPLIYDRRTLSGFRDHIKRVHRCSLEGYICSLQDFSEFNALGAFALRFTPQLYDWRIADPETDGYCRKVKQFWSHEEVGSYICDFENLLREPPEPVAGDLTTLTNRRDVGKWLNASGLTGSGVEVGVLNGENAEAILEHWKGHLYLVDLWKRQEPGEYRDGTNNIDFDGALCETAKRISRFSDRAIIKKRSSDEAFEFFRYNGTIFDFIYLDANHSSPQFDKDMENYWPLLRSGGLFGGHDYLDRDTPEWKCTVKSVVDEFFGRLNLPVHVTQEYGGHPSWWVIKP